MTSFPERQLFCQFKHLQNGRKVLALRSFFVFWASADVSDQAISTGDCCGGARICAPAFYVMIQRHGGGAGGLLRLLDVLGGIVQVG